MSSSIIELPVLSVSNISFKYQQFFLKILKNLICIVENEKKKKNREEREGGMDKGRERRTTMSTELLIF